MITLYNILSTKLTNYVSVKCFIFFIVLQAYFFKLIFELLFHLLRLKVGLDVWLVCHNTCSDI